MKRRSPVTVGLFEQRAVGTVYRLGIISPRGRVQAGVRGHLRFARRHLRLRSRDKPEHGEQQRNRRLPAAQYFPLSLSTTLCSGP